MVCPYNNRNCINASSCDCDEGNGQAALGTLAGLLIGALLIGILMPAIKIMRLPSSRSGQLTGTRWILLSPVFAWLSSMVFSLVIALPLAARMGDPKINAAVKVAVFGIYLITLVFALLAFAIKNRTALKELVLRRQKPDAVGGRITYTGG